MYTLEDKLGDLTINELYRIWNCNKDYIVIDISVCNAGVTYKVICTNDYNRYENMGDNGYSFIIPNEYEENATIEGMLLKKVDEISTAWSKYCYDYESFSDFLKQYGISEYKYRQLLELQKNSIVNI